LTLVLHMQIGGVLAVLLAFPPGRPRFGTGAKYGVLVAHPWTPYGSALVTLRHSLGLEFGQPLVEITASGAARSDEGEQFGGGRDAPLNRYGAVGLALRGDAKQRHPEATRGKRAQIERRIVGPIGPEELRPSELAHGRRDNQTPPTARMRATAPGRISGVTTSRAVMRPP
jgi:hypothetical protein